MNLLYFPSLLGFLMGLSLGYKVKFEGKLAALTLTLGILIAYSLKSYPFYNIMGLNFSFVYFSSLIGALIGTRWYKGKGRKRWSISKMQLS